MLELKKIGLTGIIASGKSTVCQFFRELGAYVISADAIVHQLLTIKTDIGQKVIELCGSDIVEDYQINRRKIAQRVFADPSLLEQLEALTHPAVKKEIEDQYLFVSESRSATLFIAEIPLLFEAGFNTMFDSSVVIVADETACRKRFMEKTGYSADDYNSRMSRQYSQEVKTSLADVIISNQGSKEELRRQVVRLYQHFTQ